MNGRLKTLSKTRQCHPLAYAESSGEKSENCAAVWRKPETTGVPPVAYLLQTALQVRVQGKELVRLGWLPLARGTHHQ